MKRVKRRRTSKLLQRKPSDEINKRSRVTRKTVGRRKKLRRVKNKIKGMSKAKLVVNNSRNEATEDSRPSTSREAETQISSTSQGKRKNPTRPFAKFKDDKHKNRTKNSITKANGKLIRYGCSPSQIVSRKILRTIKRKISPNNSRTQIGAKRRSPNRTGISDLTVVKNVLETKITNDDDDDCVLIETPTEVILIDDESVPSRDASNVENFSNSLNISNIPNLGNNGKQLLKPYQPIGSLAGYLETEHNFHKRLHSTPNFKASLNDSTVCPPAPQFVRNLPMIVEATPNAVDCINPNVRTNETVVIEDTIDETITNRKRKSPPEDDSVIFVSEVVNKFPMITADFIPLSTPTEKYHISTTPHEPKLKRQRNELLFNPKEQKLIQQYNENAYNPHKDTPAPVTKKRMVIVDGSNVAYHHALNKEFSVKGLKICLEYFEKLGHEVKAVVPQFRLQKLKSSDPTALEKLHEEGKIVFTPCKNLPGKSSSSYDDRFILQLAAELDAAIVSNDNYRDLLHENPAFKKIIENRVVGFSWCNDLFILPKDPYGKWGPTLSSILNRS